MFLPDTPLRCTSSARMLNKPSQDKRMAGHLAAQSYWLYGLSPGAPGLRGNLYSGFAPQYAARARSLLQMLVFTRLWPAAPIKNKLMVANELTPPLAVCRKQMTQRSAPSGSFETPQSSGP